MDHYETHSLPLPTPGNGFFALPSFDFWYSPKFWAVIFCILW